MPGLFNDIKYLWKHKLAFRLALGYLIFFMLLAISLPWLPLPYMPEEHHLDRVYQPPFQNDANLHWLGTDKLGRDVTANLLYGARTAIFISLPVACTTALLGLFLGLTAGYYGDSGYKAKRGSLALALVAACLFTYLGLYIPVKASLLGLNSLLPFVSLLSFLLIMLGLSAMEKLLSARFKWLRKLVALPVDQIVLRLIEALTSVPRLVFILVLASFLPPTVSMLTAVLILTYWTGTARLARAEIIKIKSLPYFESARSLGVTSKSIIFSHALPNMLGPLLLSFTFSLASLLTFESTLSFLGIGIPNTLPSWGRTIADIRQNTTAWWVLAFPGTFLLVTVMALQVTNYYILSLNQNKKQ